jgi:membrane protease subunit HflC
MVIAGVLVVALGVIALSSVYTVHQTQQVLILQFGDPRRVVTEAGLHFKYPFVENIERLDRRILGFDALPEEIIALDQKRLVVDAFLRYRISDPLQFYKAVRDQRIAEERLRTLLSSNLRRVLGSVPLENLLTGERAALMSEILILVNEQAEELGIVAVDVRIKRADLPDANNQAIYGRMNSEREREAREFRAQGAEISQRIRARADRERTVLLAEADKQGQILRGEGDGRRNRIFADAFGADPEFFAFYRSMEAYKVALGSGDTTMVLSPDSEFFRYFGALDGSAPLQEGSGR